MTNFLQLSLSYRYHQSDGQNWTWPTLSTRSKMRKSLWKTRFVRPWGLPSITTIQISVLALLVVVQFSGIRHEKLHLCLKISSFLRMNSRANFPMLFLHLNPEATAVRAAPAPAQVPVAPVALLPRSRICKYLRRSSTLQNSTIRHINDA